MIGGLLLVVAFLLLYPLRHVDGFATDLRINVGSNLLDLVLAVLVLQPLIVSLSRNAVRWRVDIGAPYLGRQDRAHEWVANRTLVSAQPIGGGSRIADLYLVPGQSSGDVFLFGVADPAYNASLALAAQGWPLLMDLDTSHTSESNQDTLTGFADGNFSAFHNGYRIVKARVRMNPRPGDGPRLAEWSLGDLGRFQVRGYIGVPDGVYYCRIIGAEPATLEELELELQLVSEVLA
jgi:hypothetical protein